MLSLRMYPDSVLRRVCDPVDKFDSTLRDLLDEMQVLMRANNGVGLAGPQVGVLRRLFIGELEGRFISLINPLIKDSFGEADFTEGCLSLPSVQVNITRNQQIRVIGYDSNGLRKHFATRGLWARIIQHEIDHLNGVLICDYGETVLVEPEQREQ